MKTGLSIRQANIQTLTMTPQLQQAIRLLQLSSAELQVEIQENLDKNPLLEIDETSTNSSFESLDAITENEFKKDRPDDDFNPFNNDQTVSQDDAHYSEFSNTETQSYNSEYDNPKEQSNEVGDIWSDNPTSKASGNRNSFDNSDEVYQGETKYELKDHLMWQLNLTPFTEKDKFIAEVIIDAIDDSGYLQEKTEDILETVKYEYDDTEIEEIETVLKLIQNFDPVGVGSRNVKESLLIQLSQLDLTDEINQLAYAIIKDNLELLGNRDFKSIIKKLSIKDESKLKKAIDVITSLEPRPGNCIKQGKAEFIIPDVAVVKKGNEWVVELNPAATPKLKINETYSELCKGINNSNDAQYVKSHIQEANWFIQSLNKRNDTLLKVATCIVKQQQDFFEKGEHAMKPLVLNDIAMEVNMHESTISRVTTEKYMYTPRGTYELKYFFSSHVSTENGGEFSSTAIRALIKELISTENPRKPLSDSKISDLLKEKGIMVARRTVAKYRESLNISSSSQRKNLL